MTINKKTSYWILFSVALYTLMFILIPFRKGPKLTLFGILLGFVQAIILNFFSVKKLKLWKLPGDYLYKGIPILTSLSWVPPVIFYAYYFPYKQKSIYKIVYTLFFALGTTAVQHLQGIIGMWESKRWKSIYTLPLSILTHIIMAIFLKVLKFDNIRENSSEIHLPRNPIQHDLIPFNNEENVSNESVYSLSIQR